MSISAMIPLLMIKGVLNSVKNGIDAVVPTEMIGESVDYMEWKTGQRGEGISFSVLTFTSKFSNAISRSLGVFLLKYVNYNTSAERAFISQTQQTKSKIWFMYLALPIAFKILKLIPIMFYDIVGEKKNNMLRELEERRKIKAHELSLNNDSTKSN